MFLPTETQVLVVGAGPTGLATAITLAAQGVQVTIVDSSSSNRNGSRAAIVHPHTLEVLDTIDLANTVIEAGVKSRGVLFRGKTEKLIEFNMPQLRRETKFPMSVHIAQVEVERIFSERLSSYGIEILRNKNVVGWTHDVRSQNVQVKFEDGTDIRAQYVVGADGSHSAIRQLAGIGFKDPRTGIAYDDAAPPSFHMALADVYLEEPLPASIPHDQLSAHLDTFILLVPLRTPINQANVSEKPTSFWRIGYGIPAGSSTDAPHAPSLAYLQQEMDARNPWGSKITIASISASSRYRVRFAIADTYFKKVGGCANVLLAGDAAHVHSPAGGQGMNLGICDGIAAARAIHAHIKSSTIASGDSGEKRDADLALRHYADVRRKTGIRVVRLAFGLTALITSGATGGWRRRMRSEVLRVVRHLPGVEKAVARRIAGLTNRAE